MSEFLAQPGPDAVVDRAVASVAFHHNLIVVTKDTGERMSNFPLDRPEVRDALMRPAEGAER
jgi:predicted nucleic acid-binding protein